MSEREPPKPSAVTIPPGCYPVIAGSDAAGLLRALRDPRVGERVASTLAAQTETMRQAVLDHVARLETVGQGGDPGTLYAEAHEIRGLAGNAGLNATGRIANGLCRYLDALSRLNAAAEPSLVGLHLDAIARAARAEDEATRLGEEVVNQLAALVNKRLGSLKD